jgi:hypothetical protein
MSTANQSNNLFGEAAGASGHSEFKYSTADIKGFPLYVGGSKPTTYEGFALAAGSLGKGNASDNLDRGIRLSITPPPPDTTPPTVSLSVPANGATVTGASVTVSATASDNVGVSGVQFKLDGANLNSEDTSSPYSITWNSTTAANGSHTLTAIARDAAGNTTVSTSRTVTVSNTSTPKPADIDKNGVVDITDLSYLLSSYGQTTTTCTTNSSFTCDIATTPSSTNGKIDIFDLSLLLSGYGK